MGIRHLVGEHALISVGVRSIISLVILGVVAALRRVVIARHSIVHVTYFLVGVDVVREADAWWCSRRRVCNHVVGQDAASGPTNRRLDDVGVCYRYHSTSYGVERDQYNRKLFRVIEM